MVFLNLITKTYPALHEVALDTTSLHDIKQGINDVLHAVIK